MADLVKPFSPFFLQHFPGTNRDEIIDRNLLAIKQAMEQANITIVKLTNTVNVIQSTVNTTTINTAQAASPMADMFLDEDRETIPLGPPGGAPSTARFWISTPDGTAPNGVNMGALGAGVLQQTVSSGIATPQALSVGTGLIPYGASGTSLLTTTSTLGYNATNGTFAVGIAPASAEPTATTHIRKAIGENLLYLESTTASSYTELALVNDQGILKRASFYYTGSTYPGTETFPNSFTVSTAGGASSHIVFSPNNTMLMDLRADGLTNFPAANSSSVTIALNKSGIQAIEKQGTGTFFIGTLGSQDLGIYTTNATRLTITAAGSVDVQALIAGGIVKAAAGAFGAGGGRLSIAAAGTDYQAPITWPGSNDVIFSPTTTTISGDAQIKIDDSADALWISNNGFFTHQNTTTSGFQSANYDRVRAFWAANVWNLKSEKGGSGTVRAMKLDADTASLTLYGASVFIGSGSTTDVTYTASSHELSINGGAINTWYNAAGVGAEFIKASWSLNIWTLKSFASGGGSVRSMIIDADTASLTMQASDTNGVLVQTLSTNVALSLNSNGAGLTGSRTIASAAGAIFNGITLTANAGITGATNITTAGGFNAIRIPIPNYFDNASAITITNSATVKIEGAPQSTAGVTFTNKWSLWVVDIAKFDGNGTHIFEFPADATVAGAQTGRIPVKIGGATAYLHYFNG